MTRTNDTPAPAPGGGPVTRPACRFTRRRVARLAWRERDGARQEAEGGA